MSANFVPLAVHHTAPSNCLACLCCRPRYLAALALALPTTAAIEEHAGGEGHSAQTGDGRDDDGKDDAAGDDGGAGRGGGRGRGRGSRLMSAAHAM